METIGAYLKRQREIRSISLQEIARLTKISLRSLQALEADDLSFLPGHVFIKGFVHSYAKAIGLSPEEATLQLEEHLKTVANASQKKDRISWLKQQHWIFKPWVFFILFLVVVVAAAYFSSR